MNPAHHLTVAATDLLKKYKYRLNTVMACIMIEALEVQGIHVPAKVSGVSLEDTRASQDKWLIMTGHVPAMVRGVS